MAAIHDMCVEIAHLRRKCAEREAACAELLARCEGLEAERDHYRRGMAELAKYDARTLLRCPECGSVKIRLHCGEWWCLDCNGTSDTRDPPLAALLAWHNVTP